MAGKPGRSGRKPTKTVEQHIAEGTFRPKVHGHLLEQVKFSPPPKPNGRVTATARSQRKWIRSAADEHAVRNGFRYNEALAEHFATCCKKYFRHSKGKWAGKPFELTDWQANELIYPLFGWVRPDGTRRFRRTYIEIPKKNYKSTTAAAIGNYCLTCDGEAGAEVYSLGADKDQAGVVHQEAIAMCEASPELKEHTHINRTTGVITYPATNSWYKKLSAAPRGKHGLNIHCAIADELHEWWGDDLWNSIRYGFRARDNWLFLVITNAGDDMDSICRRQHDKARAVLDGTTYDDSFFALVCSTSKDEADEEIRKVKEGLITDPEELTVAAKCNPGWGHVIKAEDIYQDIKDAIDTPSELPNLLRLTYSVWNVGSQPWLDLGNWDKCLNDCGRLHWDNEWKYDAGQVDLTGMSCYGGLDLAKNRDLTAFVLCFANDDKTEYWQLPVFWMPEETAESRINLASYTEWAEEGLIRLLPGEAIDYDAVIADIEQLYTVFGLNEVLYDPWQAEPLRQRLEYAGIPCTKFEQSLRHFAGPTEDYERLVNAGVLHHNGNGLLRWQAAHCEVKSDQNKNKRPVKRKAGDYRTIDGIVAGVMALFGAMTGEAASGYYDDHELEVA